MIGRRGFVAVIVCLVLSTVCFADFNKDGNRVAIKGYDPVAYFTDKAVLQGGKEHSWEWMDAVWYFANNEHKEMFIKDPVKYAPQYGGYCAYGVSKGAKPAIDPQAFSIVDGKLYLNFSKSVRAAWERNSRVHIKRADIIWKRIGK